MLQAGDGERNATFGSGGGVIVSFLRQVNTIAIQADGKIVAAGAGWVSDEFGVLARYENEPPPITEVKFDPPVVRSGSSFTATFSGTNLTDDTYFDVRFRAPGSVTDQIAWNWQRGASASHTLPGGVATGERSITAVRPHRNPDNHDGAIISVSATLSVTAPIP